MNARFGEYGGQYVPEVLVPALMELEREYANAMADPAFRKELNDYNRHYGGRETPLYFARRLTEMCGGAKVYLKREDLCHGGAHKFNNVMGQALLARRMGKERLIAETGAGQHGVATAMAAAVLGLRAEVYMGERDVARQRMNVFRMELLGAKVHEVRSGSRLLKDAINEALRDWAGSVESTHYLMGTAAGPHPYPTMVRDFQSVIGREIRAQLLEAEGRLPDLLVACVGGGSNAIGTFHPFLGDEGVRLLGAEAAGEGLETGHHSASLTRGEVGVLHGCKAYLLQDEHGMIKEAHSVAPGLDYPGVGPEHCLLKDIGRAEYVGVTDRQALDAFVTLSRVEGIIPALESAHAVHAGMAEAARMKRDDIVVITVSGRGDKDLETVFSLGVVP
ncbi:MAG TPA: tryptophan synthase subunit beta [Methanomassiliicoccales archaeon]|jgi:tryptophan synthase beta chain|nr:tryptophan synthase subunit beta [Methanomassiliicoccales archaeon]HQM66857.1 tryptophan synthase subunit beta [Methanomassiliicoccales archaeon]